VIAGGASHSYFDHNEWESIAPEITSINRCPRDYDKRAADTIARRIRDEEPYVSV
jgi:hypothetical protein